MHDSSSMRPNPPPIGSCGRHSVARLEFFAVAESVSVDQNTNKVSLFEILESVPFNPQSESNEIRKCVAVSLWRAEDGDEGLDFQVILRMFRPGEEPSEFATNFSLSGARHRIYTTIVGLPLNAPGELRFEILLNGQHAAEHVVTVLEAE